MIINKIRKNTNNNPSETNIVKGQRGQTLLFIVVAMTIALSVGINASVRTLSSLSRTSRTDTASRALAAAEGGVERFLVLSASELNDVSDQIHPSSCPAGEEPTQTKIPKGGGKFEYVYSHEGCKIEFEGSSDKLTSQAFVTVEKYDPESYPFSLESGQVKEISLYDNFSGDQYSSSNITICWNPQSADGSDLIYLSYNRDGIQQRGGLTSQILEANTAFEEEGFDTVSDGASMGHNEYTYCETIDMGANDIYGLRIRSLGAASDVEVFAENSAILPLQGFRIKSVGRLKQDEAIVATRVIRVVRTLPYLPASFDYALYTQGGILK